MTNLVVIEGHGLNNSPNLISLNVKGMKIMTTSPQTTLNKEKEQI
jgi:hypothetical protein